MEKEMASLRAALLLVSPFSVVAVMAARWLCRVMARKLSAQLACLCLPSGGPSFRYHQLVEDIIKIKGGGGGELPVALYSRRTTTRRLPVLLGEEEEREEEEECVFCLSGIEEGSEVRELQCRHLFHRYCLDRWLRARPVAATCPLCRGRLLSSPPPPWEVAGYEYDEEEEEAAAAVEEDSADSDSDSDMMLFMACVHSRSSWLWPS